MISELPRYWIFSLFKHEKKQFTALDGVFLVFFAAMTVCLFGLVISFLQTVKLDVMNFIFNAFVMPAIVLAVAFLFVLSIRISSSFFGGKGTIGEEWQAVAPSLGSLVLVCGIFCIIWMNIYGAVQGALIGTMPEGTAGYLALASKAGTIFPLMGFFIGTSLLFIAYLFGAAHGYWLENLKTVENIEINKLSKLIWLGIGITLLVLSVGALIAVGIWISSQVEALLAGAGATA